MTENRRLPAGRVHSNQDNTALPFGGIKGPNDDVELSDKEREILLGFGGNLEDMGKFMEQVRERKSGTARRSSGKVVQLSPTGHSDNVEYVEYEKTVEKIVHIRHYVQKLSGLMFGVLLGVTITLVAGYFSFSYLLSEGYIRQYFF